MRSLNVFREYLGSYEMVGRIVDARKGGPRFSYDPGYLSDPAATAISRSLPLTRTPYSIQGTRAFFDGLIPEGPMREAFEHSTRAGRNDFLTVLEAVRNEPIGALIFSSEDDLGALERAYEPLNNEDLSKLAAAPGETAVDYSLRSRISLAGAQSKIGLYRDVSKAGSEWYLPRGSAPSTHILKACGRAYPNETVNEAICLRAARYFEIEVPDCFLIQAGGADPILAIKRYDRVISPTAQCVDGLAVPTRLHQVDACQASGLLGSDFKYEPSGAAYFNRLSALISEMSANPFDDKLSLTYMQLFHYVVGNADNHLKNWSFIYDEDWDSIRLAPLYDVLDTTIYESLPLEMGVSFGGSRRIDEVTKGMVFDAFERAGIPKVVVKGAIDASIEELPACIERAAADLASEGFPGAKAIAGKMLEGAYKRLEVLKG